MASASDFSSTAPRHILQCRPNYFCAPQVFYFRPHEKWYLIYQVHESERNLGLQPAFSTPSDISAPNFSTPAALFFPEVDPTGVHRWIDFWLICDATHAYLFFTSLDGSMWRKVDP